MIHEIGVELQAAIRARGCPFAVIDGPEGTTTTTYARERIVIEHDDGGDGFGPPRSTHKNPTHRMTRSVGMKLTIYAQSSSAGALEFEHVRRAERVLDIVLVALGDVASVRRNAWSPTGGKFIQPKDLEKSENTAGAVYELTFTFDRAVMARTWAGAARPEMTLGANGIWSTTKVSGANGPDGDPNTVPASAETSCGS